MKNSNKREIVLIMLLVLFSNALKAQFTSQKIGTNPTKKDASAVLEIEATDKGILIPRLKTTERDAIARPATALTIYNTDTKCIEQYRDSISLWYNICTRTISGAGSASLDCSNAKRGAILFYNAEPSTPIPAGYQVSLPYTNGNGGVYTAQSIASTGVTGITATLPAGNFVLGSGDLVFNISGTPSTAGTATFSVTIGGSSCSFTLTFKNGASASNCTTMVGMNIPTFPVVTQINIGGEVVNVSKIVDIGTNGTAKAVTGYAQNHCGANLLDDGSAFRIGSANGANGCVGNSVKLIFSKPVNDISIVSNWYAGDGTPRRSDAHTVSTNSIGTISSVNILSNCASDFLFTGSGTSSITCRLNVYGNNTRGLTYLVRATTPFTEITLSRSIEGNYDDIIAAFAVCDAYVAQ